MKVKINKEISTIPDHTNIEELLKQKGLSNWVAVFINGIPILQSDYNSTYLNDDDDIKIIVPLGGG